MSSEQPPAASRSSPAPPRGSARPPLAPWPPTGTVWRCSHAAPTASRPWPPSSAIGPIAIEADVTDRDSIAAAAERVRTELGGADILVNNAGVMLLGAVHLRLSAPSCAR